MATLSRAYYILQEPFFAQAAIVSMIAVPDVAKADVTNHRNKAHYLLIVTAPPKKPAPAKPPVKANDKKRPETKPKR